MISIPKNQYLQDNLARPCRVDNLHAPARRYFLSRRTFKDCFQSKFLQVILAEPASNSDFQARARRCKFLPLAGYAKLSCKNEIDGFFKN